VLSIFNVNTGEKTMNGLEKIPTGRDQWVERQKKYNLASKNIIGILGANLSLFVCILLPMLLIGFIWTDVGAPELGIGLVSDGVVTVALFITGELLMMNVGADGGKLDNDYQEAKGIYTSLTARVNELGTMLLHVFCEWQIDIEYHEAVSARLKALMLTKEEWHKLKDRPYKELESRYGKRKAKAILAINGIEPIELNEAVLMYEDEVINNPSGSDADGMRFLPNAFLVIDPDKYELPDDRPPISN